jgi:hypothetical protein
LYNGEPISRRPAVATYLTYHRTSPPKRKVLPTWPCRNNPAVALRFFNELVEILLASNYPVRQVIVSILL